MPRPLFRRGRRALRGLPAWCAMVAVCLIVAGNSVWAQAKSRKSAAGRAAANQTVPQAGMAAPDRAERDEAGAPAPDEERAQPDMPGGLQPEQLLSRTGISSTINLLILLTVLSLAPSILVMTTCFIRFVIVLGLLRQALGTQQLPPNQVLIGLCLFLTFMVMSPIWQQCYEQGILPYAEPAPGAAPPTLNEAFENTARPLRRFMGDQIELAQNSETVWMFLEYSRPPEGSIEAETYVPPDSYDQVPLATLASAYMLSELKAAFIIGFQIFLPFLVIDMVVATVLMSMGMMMLPPTLVSFPFKLLLFVLIDGWALTVGMMLASVRPSG